MEFEQREVAKSKAAPPPRPSWEAVRSPRRGPLAWFRDGGWYFLVTVGTLGLCACVPFLHGARRKRTPPLIRRAVAYVTLNVLLWVLLFLTPTQEPGEPVSAFGETISALGGLLMLTVLIAAVIQQRSLRRTVFFAAAEPRPAAGDTLAYTPGPGMSATDSAVAGVLQARSRRERARELAAEDPLMARELRIGRPDLERTYDDGGLVDLNAAPAETITTTCGIDPVVAAALVATRQRRGTRFGNVDEALLLADVPVEVWSVLRDRAIVLPLSS